MQRDECMQAIAPLFTDELFVTTNGGATTEWSSVRPSDANMQVKTMGLCSSIGLGLALALPHRRVVVMDGDGSLWMNLGSLATIGLHQPTNLIHICWDNKSYEASGGEPTATAAEHLDFAAVARGTGIASSWCVLTIEDLRDCVRDALNTPGPHFVWACIEPGHTITLERPCDELENKYRFVRHIEQTEGLTILRMPLGHSQER
ncbi:MAG: thiamine pyrophosphate-binding protein [Chloroflexi bacterium]|nr:thiamine pyrophosphate-binding protein [Chloroflexota bacterium]